MKRNILLVTGLLLTVAAFKAAIIPFGIAIGGFSGLGTLLNQTLGWPYLMSSAILNGVLLVWAGVYHGGKSVIRAAISMFCFNALLDVVPSIEWPTLVPEVENVIVVVACIAAGSGIGMVIRAGGSTGGSDYLSEIITLMAKSLSRGAASTMVNISIVCCTAILMGIQNLPRAIISTVLVNECINVTLYVKSNQPIPRSLHCLRVCGCWLKERVLGFKPKVKLDALKHDVPHAHKGQQMTVEVGDHLIVLEVVNVIAK